MTPRRCRLCISDPATRLEKLEKRRVIIQERMMQLADQLYLVESEISAFTEGRP